MSTETRQRLIDQIIQAYYSNDRERLRVGRIAELAGITRQALHRYHEDLLPYIKGDKNIADLLPKTEQTSVNALLEAAQQRVQALESELLGIKIRHEKELEERITSYITSLMKNDITLFDTDEITTSFQKQTALLTDYTEQITELKAKLAKATLSCANPASDQLRGNRTVLEPKLHKALAAYKNDKDYDKYLNSKDKELEKIISKINSFTSTNTKLTVFLDHYICDFSQYTDSLPPPTQDEIIVRAPIHTTFELKSFFKKVTMPGFKVIYIPEYLSLSESVAQRKFRASSIPEEELALASKAEKVHIFKGVNEVIHHAMTLNTLS